MKSESVFLVLAVMVAFVNYPGPLFIQTIVVLLLRQKINFFLRQFIFHAFQPDMQCLRQQIQGPFSDLK